MHKILVYAAYGWLALGGMLHFAIDVAAQYLRGKRAPGPETTLYYGLNSAFALGQVVFGLLGLWLAWRAADLLRAWPVRALSIGAALGWLAIALVFLEYWEPKFAMAVFGVLVIAAALVR